MDDLISRQAAIDEIKRFIGYLDEDMITRLSIAVKRLPTAEPEIIRCKDCEWFRKEYGWNRVEYTQYAEYLQRIIRLGEKRIFAVLRKGKKNERNIPYNIYHSFVFSYDVVVFAR